MLTGPVPAYAIHLPFGRQLSESRVIIGKFEVLFSGKHSRVFPLK
jgi:hypothetical protein